MSLAAFDCPLMTVAAGALGLTANSCSRFLFVGFAVTGGCAVFVSGDFTRYFQFTANPFLLPSLPWRVSEVSTWPPAVTGDGAGFYLGNFPRCA